jgi:hypothetical protein
MAKQNLHKKHPQIQSKSLWKQHKLGWLVIVALLTMSTAAVKDNAEHLQLSVLTIPEHAPFDGTVNPVQNVPDWIAATTDERGMNFSGFPASKLIDIPSYDANRLSVSSSNLVWGDDYDDYTLTMKTTYPVVYAGTYRLDGIEDIGGHPAVDIKALKGTPVYNVMNGVVERVAYSDYGFGNLVVVRHSHVPSPDNPNLPTTLYSGYAHLDTINVAEGDILSKGTQLGTIGDTGTATTDHLHFQIDNDDAPWHMYWPFTTAEANAVGGFFEAVNQGVGQSNLYAYTIHPMEYLQDYLDVDYEIILTSEDDAASEEEVATEETTESVVESVDVTDVITEEVAPEEEVAEEEEEEDVYVPPFTNMEFDLNVYMEEGTEQMMTVSLVDERGELVLNPSFNADITVTASDPEVLGVTGIGLDKSDFTKGYNEIKVQALASGSATLSFEFLDDTYTTEEIVVAGQLKPLDSFAIETDGEFYLGEAEPIVIVALNEDEERLPSFELDEPIQFEVVLGDGFFSRHAITENDFEDGMATLEFTPLSEDSIILGVYSGDIEGRSTQLTPTLFMDLTADDDYYQAIEYLKALGVVQGYEDHTFRSTEAVSRVEILKMMYEAFMKELVPGSELDFPDTDATAWYAPYVATAQQEGIVQGDGGTGMFRPADSVNRVEAIKILSLALGVDVDPVVIGNPFEDVHYLDWYAPYAQLGAQMNILPWDAENLEAGSTMTRGEVAEMIYRVIAIQQNSADNYVSTLVVN